MTGDGFSILRPVPVDCYFILIDRFRGGQPNVDANPHFAKTREQLNQKVQISRDGKPVQLSNLAVVDALLGKKKTRLLKANMLSKCCRSPGTQWMGRMFYII